jgi:hypothetical protein
MITTGSPGIPTRGPATEQTNKRAALNRADKAVPIESLVPCLRGLQQRLTRDEARRIAMKYGGERIALP